MTPAEEVAKILLDINAVTLRPSEPYRYTSGLLSPIYTDCRLLIGYPKERSRVIELMAGLLDSSAMPDVIAGTSTAGIPHAAWLAQSLKLPMVYVRSKAKDHGKMVQIEGKFEAGQSAVVIEDLISTAGSSLEAVTAINAVGGKADTILAIFFYELPLATQNLEQAGVTLKSLTTFMNIVDMALKQNKITQEERAVIVEWNKDSVNWGRNHGFEN